MEFYEYISPELISLLPILYATGTLLKKSSISDWMIPFIIGLISIILSCAWTSATATITSAADIFVSLASGIMQGVLCASVTVYAHNLVKQYGKRGNGNDKETYA